MCDIKLCEVTSGMDLMIDGGRCKFIDKDGDEIWLDFADPEVMLEFGTEIAFRAKTLIEEQRPKIERFRDRKANK